MESRVFAGKLDQRPASPQSTGLRDQACALRSRRDRFQQPHSTAVAYNPFDREGIVSSSRTQRLLHTVADGLHTGHGFNLLHEFAEEVRAVTCLAIPVRR